MFATEFAGLLVAAGATEPVYRLANQAYMAGTSRAVTTLDGQQVTFKAQPAGTGPWTSIGTAPITTDSDGMTAATVEATPSANTVYRASWPGNDTTLAWSATTAVTVVPPIGIEGKRKGKGWSLTLSSDPQVAGTQVVAEAKV